MNDGTDGIRTKGAHHIDLTRYRGLAPQIVELPTSASSVGIPTTQVEYQDFCKE